MNFKKLKIDKEDLKEQIKKNLFRNLIFLLMLIVFLLFFRSVYSFSTSETIVLNKIANNNNFSDSQQVVFYDLFKTSNETKYINDEIKKIENLLYLNNETINLRLNILENKISEIETNISNFKIEESEVDIIEAQIKLIEATKQEEEKTTSDIVTEYLESLKKDKEVATSTNINNLSNYYNKEEVKELIEEINLDEFLTNQDLNLFKSSLLVKDDDENYILLYVIIGCSLFTAGIFYSYKTIEKERIDKRFLQLNQKIKNLETKLENKKEKKEDLDNETTKIFS